MQTGGQYECKCLATKPRLGRVRVVERWILAAPRTALFSLDDLNAGSAVLLERLNRRRSRGRRPPAPATKAISGLFGITASTCSFEYSR